MKYSICIVTHCAVEQAKKCLASVFKYSDNYELILVANGSKAAAEYFGTLKAIHGCVQFENNLKNEGFIKPIQAAAELAQGARLVLLNDDCTVSPNWLQKMESEFIANPKAAIVGVKGTPCTIGPNWGGYVGPILDYCEFSCAMIKMSVLKKHGFGFDGLVGAYLEDIWFSLRMRELGYTIHHADVAIQHERSATSRHVPEVQGWIQNNVEVVRKRWGHYLKTRSFVKPTLLPGKRIERNGTNPTVTLVYVYVPQRLEYQGMAVRFMETYEKYPAGYPHKLLVVSNGPEDRKMRWIFSRGEPSFMFHDNIGWDLGAYIAAAKIVDTDIVVLCGSNTYFKKEGWMKRFVEAWQQHGPGMYGAFASYEVRPHLNSTLFACPPALLIRYPTKVVTKDERYEWEHGNNSFWKLVAADGYPVRLVTWDQTLDWQDWRKPDNIMRRGDQSNCLGGFRITDEYERYEPNIKAASVYRADTLTEKGLP